MARYRKIDCRVWCDERFKKLSPMQPSGQALWLFLLSNEFTCSLPGAFRAGKAAMAEVLDWSVRDFEKAWSEIETAGMARADWTARMVWLPGALRYNRPESPNVVRAWSRAYHELPECALKTQVGNSVIEYLSTEGFAPSFFCAFDAETREVCDDEPTESTDGELPIESHPSDSGSSDVQTVVNHYKVYHPRAFPKIKASAKEFRSIKARLAEGWTAKDLCEAIDGQHASPWHNGENEQKKQFLSLELVVRDSDHVQRFLEILRPANKHGGIEGLRP